MKQIFYSHGKLLLTGEYAVLDGAVGLTIPTRKGQSLEVTKGDKKGIHWKSYTVDGLLWYEEQFAIDDTAIISSSSNKTSITLQDILQTAIQLNPSFLNTNTHCEVITRLEFDQEWGLGTSSTLINNIAQWAQINAFELLEKSFGGSGYDIAAAQYDTPVFYQKDTPPVIRKAILNWDFTNQLYFVHLNQKQDSKEGIAHYRKTTVSKKEIQRITDISHKLLMCYTLEDFSSLMEAHEQLISGIIDLPTVKERLFPNYTGCVKSLGAWGGDFILVTAKTQEQLNYFIEKGYTTIVSYKDMVL